jgi:hypothetical protein
MATDASASHKRMKISSLQHVLHRYRSHESDIKKLVQKAASADQASKTRRSQEQPEYNSDKPQSQEKRKESPLIKHSLLSLPVLTEEEEKSSLGILLGSLMMILRTLEEKLAAHRAVCRIKEDRSSKVPHHGHAARLDSTQATDQKSQSMLATNKGVSLALNSTESPAPPLRTRRLHKRHLSEMEAVDVASINGDLDDDEMFHYLKEL